MTKRPFTLVHIDDTDDQPVGNDAHFGGKYGSLHRASQTGNPKAVMGASVMRVPPGKAAFPIHHHYASDEHFYVISGSGTLRVGDETFAVRAGHYMAHPPGGPETAHQLINTGDTDLVYLAVGAMTEPEIVGYPDSGKTLAKTSPYGVDGVRFMVLDETRDQAEYFDREDGAAIDAVLKSTGK